MTKADRELTNRHGAHAGRRIGNEREWLVFLDPSDKSLPPVHVRVHAMAGPAHAIRAALAGDDEDDNEGHEEDDEWY